jgi:(2Fe-2S) ferredoxin
MICVRGQCSPAEKGKTIETLLHKLIAKHGLDDPDHAQHATVTLTNCLAVCADGPVLIVHPEGVKYHKVDEPSLERIFHEHIIGGQPIDELRAPGSLPRSIRL